jgi:gamma-glutamyltranspeptidase/glutathione hydrolase
MHHQWLPDEVTIEEAGATPEVVQKLRAYGHTVKTGRGQGDANSISVDATGTAWGAADKRTPDGKASSAGRLTSTSARK